MDKDLNDRLFQFVIKVAKFLRAINSTSENSVYKYQLTKSSASSGANYEEAQAASSRADFRNKINISLREMRESHYWLRIFKDLEIGDKTKCLELIREADELRRILGSISSKVKN